MKKRQKKTRTMTASAPQKMEAFTFGEPSAVLDRRDILDYVECVHNGRWYEPPVNFSGLAKSLRSAVHHSSPIYVKAQYHCEHLHSAPAVVPSGFQPSGTGLPGICQRLSRKTPQCDQ